MDLQELNEIAARVTAGEYSMYLSMYRGSTGNEVVRVVLEKGSTYGKFHLKIEATGATPSEAFEIGNPPIPPQSHRRHRAVGHEATRRHGRRL